MLVPLLGEVIASQGRRPSGLCDAERVLVPADPACDAPAGRMPALATMCTFSGALLTRTMRPLTTGPNWRLEDTWTRSEIASRWGGMRRGSARSARPRLRCSLQ